VLVSSPTCCSVAHKIRKVNHRGGKPGFVKVMSPTELVVPDFTGNFHFSSLGNIASTGVCGLYFVDPASGAQVLMTCKARIDWDSELRAAFAGAERLVWMTVLEVLLPQNSVALQFREGQPSAILTRTGDWTVSERRKEKNTIAVESLLQAAEETLEAAKTNNTYLPFVVQSCEPENETGTIVSITLAPQQGGVPAHLAGQFLPVKKKKIRFCLSFFIGFVGKIRLGGETRTYTVSDCSNNHTLRMSVKREGKVSTMIHGLKPGSVVEALAPRGDFVFQFEARTKEVFLFGCCGVF
jgi:hypothetical protein